MTVAVSAFPAPYARAPVNKWVVTLSVTFGTLMGAIDTSIVAVATPHLTGALGATVEEMTWVTTGFVIATVKTGTVTFTRDCKSTDYGPGSVFVESGDSPGQASSTNGATVYATFVAPHVDATAGGPVFRIEDNPPSCP